MFLWCFAIPYPNEFCENAKLLIQIVHLLQSPLYYDGIPIIVDENQPDTEVRGSSGAVCSSIYPITFGPEGVMGIENGNIAVEEIGEMETKDATRHRIKWYAGLAVFSELAVARLGGITAA